MEWRTWASAREQHESSQGGMRCVEVASRGSPSLAKSFEFWRFWFRPDAEGMLVWLELGCDES